MSLLNAAMNGGATTSGGASDATIGELAVVQAVNSASVSYGWSRIEDASALPVAVNRLYGATIVSNTFADLFASSSDRAAVFASTALLTSLGDSAVASSALVTSAAAMSDLAASESAMRAALSSHGLFSKIMTTPSARSTFTSSSALAQATIPNHVASNTSAAGVISASNSGVRPPYYSVDADGSYWIPEASPAWLEYTFNAPCVIHTASWHHQGTQKAQSGDVEAYVNGAWLKVGEMSLAGVPYLDPAYLNTPVSSTRWRVNNITPDYVRIYDFRLFGFYV